MTSSILDQELPGSAESAPILPSSPADRIKLRTMISEGTYCLQRVKDEREALKDLIDAIHEKYKTPKKLIRRCINTHFNRNFENVQGEAEDFELMYEGLFASEIAGTTPVSDEESAD